MSVLSRMFRGLRRSEDGATAIEFAFVAPVLFFALFSLVEIGMLGMMTSGVDNAVYEAARRIRTGREDAATSAATFEDQICARLGGDLVACRERLVTSVQRFSRFTDANLLAAQPPDNSFNKGAAEDIIIVKADYRWPLMTPFLATTNGRTGPLEITLASRVTFKNEPFE